jgi:hypothetical protein
VRLKKILNKIHRKGTLISLGNYRGDFLGTYKVRNVPEKYNGWKVENIWLNVCNNGMPKLNISISEKGNISNE